MRSIAELQLPFDGSFLVHWGGESAVNNAHHADRLQKYAIDFVRTDEAGAWYSGDGKHNEDYFGFGRDVLSPVDGRIEQAVDGFRDNAPGNIEPYNVFGNHLIIRAGEGHEYIVLAHLKLGSLAVAAGATVSLGQRVAALGNSGNSSAPHLHFQVHGPGPFAQTGTDGPVGRPSLAASIPPYFNSIALHQADGSTRMVRRYSPTKGDIVSNRPTEFSA